MQSTGIIPLVPTTSGAYADGDCIGGLLTFPAGKDSGDSGILQSISIVDEAGGTAADLLLIVFDELPTSTFTDNEAPTLLAADKARVVATHKILAANFNTKLSTGFYCEAVSKGIRTKGSRDLYAVLIAMGAVTFANGDLDIKLGVMWD